MATSPSENSKNSEVLSDEEISAIAAYIFMMNNPDLEIKQSGIHKPEKNYIQRQNTDEDFN